MTQHDIINGGIAALADDSDGLLVNGVALGEDDVTHGMSGKRTRWPADVLKDAADLLVGKPITKQLGEAHVGAKQTDDGLQVSSNVPLEAKVGEVTQARYEDGVGLLWQGEIKDDEMASKVEQGLAEVSPVLAREVKQIDDDLFEATAITGVRDLGLVSNGAAPSNSIEPGQAAAMSLEALSSAFNEGLETRISRPEYERTSKGRWDAPTLNDTYGGDLEAATNAAVVKFRPVESFSEDLALFVVDGQGQLNENALQSAWRLAPQVDGLSDDEVERARSLIISLADEAFDEHDVGPAEEANNGETMPAESGVDATKDDDDPNDEPGNGEGPSTEALTYPTMDPEDITDAEFELLAAARQMDSPAVIEEEDAARLSEADELLSAADETETPMVVDEADHEALQGRIETVRGVLEEALCERTVLKESTVEALSFDALCGEFENEDGEFKPEALIQTPETGDVDEETDDVEDDEEALSEDPAVLKQRHTALKGAGMTEQAEALAEQYEEATGERLH